RPFRYVTIKPTQNSRGHLMPVKLAKGQAELWDQVITTFMTSYAGSIAESIYTKRVPSGHEIDSDIIAKLAAALIGDDKTEQALFLNWIRYRTKELLYVKWPMVEKIALALLERQTLSYAEVIALVAKERRNGM
ncbi:MAG TPA: hypothetical protein VK589_22910, partial [Chryseolinea sp.]|nr:hypothetical protein [Chryseolinea sp.]